MSVGPLPTSLLNSGQPPTQLPTAGQQRPAEETVGGRGKSPWRRRSSSASKHTTRAGRCRSARSTSGILRTSSFSAAAARGGPLTLPAPYPPANVVVILTASSPEAPRSEKLVFRTSSPTPGSTTPKSGHDNTSLTRTLILKARRGVTTILRPPATRSSFEDRRRTEGESYASTTNRQRDG